MIYLGEPTRNMLEEICGNIIEDISSRDKSSVLCLRLRLSGIKSDNNKLIFPNACWEKICITGDARANRPIDKNEINSLVAELVELRVCFGDFNQIVKMLKTKKGSDNEQ